jgi:hypothetical protein
VIIEKNGNTTTFKVEKVSEKIDNKKRSRQEKPPVENKQETKSQEAD